MNILACNSGSSSLKFSLIEAEREVLIADGGIDWASCPSRLILRQVGCPEVREVIQVRKHSQAVARVLTALKAELSKSSQRPLEIDAVGHRVVHGGNRLTAAVRITPEVQDAIRELSELAPLHNAASLEGIAATEQALPSVPQVAVFDTAFHGTLPPAAQTYAIPRAWTREWGLHRYGFHGLSHAYCAGRAVEMLGDDGFRLVIAHLGNGASVSAVRGGACIDTSMGFTPLDGLIMGTRSGSLDPGLLLYLLRHKGLTVDQLDDALNHHSGLLGLSGISSDMRVILREARRSPQARLALEAYIHRLVQTIGGMAAVLGGVDALVFTAGVGENSAQIRELVCEKLVHLGLEIDLTANARCQPDADIAGANSPARILVISTREDLTIARETKRLLGSAPILCADLPSTPFTAPAETTLK